MRLTLEFGDDVFGLAKSIAEARNISVGQALSLMARRGAETAVPLSYPNGFRIFHVADSNATFGPEDIETAFDAEDRQDARQFLNPAPAV
jgi:hypothetical protein